MNRISLRIEFETVIHDITIIINGTRRALQELKEFNIRVFCVSPGSIQTDMGKTDTRQEFSSFLRPEEVAEYIVFIIKFDNELISDELRLNRVIVQ